jgi:hypothetical protein
LKQSEICPARLPLSKSQFYRERTETLLVLANYIQHWELRTVEHRKLAAIKTLAMFAPGGDGHLIGVDSLLAQLSDALTTAEGPKLIMLSGLGGLGKTAVAQAAVERVLHADHFHALAWVNCQRDRFTGTHIETSDTPALTIHSFFDELLRQLAPNSVSDSYLFELISAQVPDEKVTFDQVLNFLHGELVGQEPSNLSLAEKRSLIIDLLWAVPTLIVVDGLEAVPGAEELIVELSRIASCTNLKVLITSRARFSECQCVKHLDVTPLAESDAVQLIRIHGAERGIEAIQKAPREDLRGIADAAGGNPLIIRWIVNHLAAIPLRLVLSDLSHVTGSAYDLCNYIYGRAWKALSPSARKVLITIAQSPDSKATWETLRRSTGLRPEILNRSLQELVASSLVPVSASLDPSYQIGSTTRTFAVAASRAVETTHEPTVSPSGTPLDSPQTTPDYGIAYDHT